MFMFIRMFIYFLVVPLEENSQVEIDIKDDEEKVVNEKGKKKNKKEKEKAVPFSRVIALNQPEYKYIFLGCVFAVISGAVNPALSIVLSKSIGAFQLCTYDERKDSIYLYCILFAVFGFIAFISYTLQVKNYLYIELVVSIYVKC
jgi:hypothetical protein